MAIIGIDLGGTKVASALFETSGLLHGRREQKLAGRTGPEVGELICSEAVALREELPGKLDAVGICVPGIARINSGTVWAPNIPGWRDYPLRAELASALKLSAEHIHLESDRSGAILGELWKGSARGCRNAVFLAVGTGIGAGILADGRILRGNSGIAGAIGWMALDRPFENKYNGIGCFEYHASGEGLIRVYTEMADRTEPANIPGSEGTGSSPNSREILAAAERGDEGALRILKRAIGYWGMAVANLVSLFNPEKVIFGGGLFGPALRYLPEIREEALRWAQPVAMAEMTLEPSLTGADAVLYGAGYLALNGGVIEY